MKYFLLTRPWTFTATLMPFLMALALCHKLYAFEFAPITWIRWAMALIAGEALLAATNLFNTWGDEKSGVDRVPGAHLTTPQIQRGEVTLKETFWFSVICVAVFVVLGAPLLFWPQFDWILGILALVGAVLALNYSTGIKYKYMGLGVIIVGILEGPFYVWVVMRILMGNAWGGTLNDWTQCFALSSPLIFLLTAMLHGNDMRDIATDKQAGIRSVAMMLGYRGSLILYIICHTVPYAIAVWYGMWGALVAVPLSLRLIYKAIRNSASHDWRGLEEGSGPVHLFFSLGYTISLEIFLKI